MISLKKRSTKLIICLVVITIMLAGNCIEVFADNTSYDYQYVKTAEYGLDDGKTATGIMEVKDTTTNEVYKTYCIDKAIEIKKDAKYSLVNLEDAHYYSTENAGKIRNIVSKAYPFITLDQVIKLTGISNLTAKEAIAGTQAAIWSYSNNATDTKLTGNAKDLYLWYRKLPANATSTTAVGKIDIIQNVTRVNDKYIVEISYKVTGKNIDGTSINAKYKIDKDLENHTYDAKIENLGKDSNGYTKIKISNLSKQVTFNFTVSGKQTLSNNVYFYNPQGGSTKSQCLVGMKADSTNISNSIAIDVSATGHTLTLKKVDTLDEKIGLANAEFKISNTKDFSGEVITVTTKSDGTATIQGLTKGQWYIKETKAPAGYIPSADVHEIYINDTDISLQLKNSKYGKIEVIKIDEYKKPVAGAKFTLYEGTTLTQEHIKKSDLISDENGKVEINEMLPGTYTLVETEAPADYILNSEPIVFEVTTYKTTTITHTNETVGIGKILITKKDAVTDEQLEGTKIAIYRDEAFTDLVVEVVTLKDKPVEINNLVPGTYYIKELKATEGYLNDAAPKKVTIAKNETAEVTFYNSKNYSTAGDYAGMLIMGGGLLAVGIALVAIKKIRAHHNLATEPVFGDGEKKQD